MVQARLGLDQPAAAGRRRRRRRAGAVPPGDRRRCGAASRPRSPLGGRAAPMIGSLRGEVLERDLDGIGADRGRRRRLPSSRVAADAGRARAVDARPSCTSTTTSARTPRRCTASSPATSGRRSRSLIATHGVGPALAMAILATHPPAALVDIVADGDVAALTLVPGVGKKTAERLLVELKSRLSGAGARRRRRSPAAASSAVGDVREALAGLGYGADEIRDALRELPADDDAADAAARRAQAAGSRPCVTSSSTRASATTPRRSSRPGCGRARSPSSSASAS